MATEKNKLELYFEWWLLEAKSHGFVKDFAREPEVITICEPAKYGRYKRFKTKEKEVEHFSLFQKVETEYDYIIEWDERAEYLFYEEVLPGSIFQFGRPIFIAHRLEDQDKIVSYIDVKPTNSVFRAGGKVSSAITFPLKQRMLWDSQRLYINKVIPMPMSGAGFKSALFIKTFVPQRYLMTDGGQQARKIKWPYKDLKEYVNTRTEYINNLLKNTV